MISRTSVNMRPYQIMLFGLCSVSLPGCAGCTKYTASTSCEICPTNIYTIYSDPSCTKAEAESQVRTRCPFGKLGSITFSSEYSFDTVCVEQDSRQTTSDNAPFAQVAETADAIRGTIHGAWFGDMSGEIQMADDGACPAGLQITVKIINNATECEDNTLYYKVNYQSNGGAQEVGPISVAPGGTGTQTLAASDSDQDDRADSVVVSWSVFDPDPVLGCGSGQSSYDGVFEDGDTLTITLSGDGGTADEVITHAAAGARTLSKAKVVDSSVELKPIPDPTFSAAAE